MSYPSSSRCLANECRRVWHVAGLAIIASRTACLTARCRTDFWSGGGGVGVGVSPGACTSGSRGRSTAPDQHGDTSRPTHGASRPTRHPRKHRLRAADEPARAGAGGHRGDGRQQGDAIAVARAPSHHDLPDIKFAVFHPEPLPEPPGPAGSEDGVLVAHGAFEEFAKGFGEEDPLEGPDG
jgi:hypothetical protein